MEEYHKRTVFSFWKEELTNQVVNKSTFVNLFLDVNIGKPHPLWQDVNVV